MEPRRDDNGFLINSDIIVQKMIGIAGGKIEKNEMVGACGAYGGGERCAHGSDWET